MIEQDPVFRALSALPPVKSDPIRIERLRARCHSRLARQRIRARTRPRLHALEIAALILLLTYWSAVIQETVRL
jgi:hypothetical protein